MRFWFLGTACATMMVAQAALGPLLTLDGGAGADLLLPLVVYIALVAPRAVTPFLYLALGVFSDLVATPHPGLRSFMFVMVGLAVENVNPGGWRRNPFVQAVLTVAGSFCVEAVYFMVAAHNWPLGLHGALRVAVYSALMTGAVSFVIGWPLNWLSRVFNWPSSGTPVSWAQVVAAAGAGVSRAPRRTGRL